MRPPSNGRNGRSQPSTATSAPLHGDSNSLNIEPLGRSATMSSASSVGEFLSRADTNRECAFKKKWLEAKRDEEVSRTRYCSEAAARMQGEDKKRRAEEEERHRIQRPDPNLVQWDENDPENPQQRENSPVFLFLSYPPNYYFSIISTKSIHHSALLRLNNQRHFRVICPLYNCPVTFRGVPCRHGSIGVNNLTFLVWIVGHRCFGP